MSIAAMVIAGFFVIRAIKDSSKDLEIEKTRIETEYVRRTDGDEKKVHLANGYTSIPEVLGKYGENDTLNNFLEFHVYNIYRTPGKDITVQKTTGDVNYELDGNGKTISTKAMIFNAIAGKVHNLTVLVVNNLVTTQDESTATDAIAPLAFSVHGSTAEISNIKVKTVRYR